MTKLTIEATQGGSIMANGSTSQIFLLLSVTDDNGRPFAGLKLADVNLNVLDAPIFAPGTEAHLQTAIEAASVGAMGSITESGFYAVGIKPSVPSGSWVGGRYVVGLVIERKSGGATLGGGSPRPLLTHAGQTIVDFTVTGI